MGKLNCIFPFENNALHFTVSKDKLIPVGNVQENKLHINGQKFLFAFKPQTVFAIIGWVRSSD